MRASAIRKGTIHQMPVQNTYICMYVHTRTIESPEGDPLLQESNRRSEYVRKVYEYSPSQIYDQKRG